MAYDAGMAETMADDLGGHPGLSEKHMFGGICWLLDGNMVCGVGKDGAMYRVGKDQEPRAMALEGALPMTFTGRKMGGFVTVPETAFGDDENRKIWTALALKNAASLPAK